MFRGRRTAIGRLQRSARLRSFELRRARFATPWACSAKLASQRSAGGARRDRTDDLMLAKHALSQLSYGPVPEDECFVVARARLRATAQQPSFKKACRAEAAEQQRLVGLGRLELPTSRLSSARSNQLSYKPLTTIPEKDRSMLARTRLDAASHKRSPWRVFVREERETKTAKSRQWSSTILNDRWPLMFLKRSDRQRQ
jgi:hypothetical protein